MNEWAYAPVGRSVEDQTEDAANLDRTISSCRKAARAISSEASLTGKTAVQVGENCSEIVQNSRNHSRFLCTQERIEKTAEDFLEITYEKILLSARRNCLGKRRFFSGWEVSSHCLSFSIRSEKKSSTIFSPLIEIQIHFCRAQSLFGAHA